MRLTKTSLAIIAVAGALAFSPSSRAQTNTPPAGGRQGGRGNVETQLTRLNEQLKLTDDQKPKVKAVLEEQSKKIQELRSNAANASQEDLRAKRQALMQDTSKKMKEILTADQFKKYEESIQQQRGRGGANGAAGAARPNRNRNGATNGAPAAGGQQKFSVSPLISGRTALVSSFFFSRLNGRGWGPCSGGIRPC